MRLRAISLIVTLATPVSGPLLCSCGGGRPVPVAVPSGSAAGETGQASWYGSPYHGRKAASGEVYDMNALTAAHRTLPFGTRVRVHNVDNSRSVIVRINDRGPFVADRVIDVSRAAARALGLIGPGLARVRLEILAASEPVESQPGEFAVQVGAFREQENAQRLRREMEKAYGRAVVLKLERDPVLWRVLAGSFATLEGAEALARRIRDQESPALPGAFAVRVDGTP